MHALESGIDTETMTQAARRFGSTAAFDFEADFCKFWDHGALLQLFQDKCPKSLLAGPFGVLSAEFQSIYYTSNGRTAPPGREMRCARAIPPNCWRFEGFHVSTTDSALALEQSGKLKSAAVEFGWNRDAEAVVHKLRAAPVAASVAGGVVATSPELRYLLDGRSRLQRLRWLFDPTARGDASKTQSRDLQRALFADPSVSLCLLFPTWLEWCGR
jgi:hypothetical protein